MAYPPKPQIQTSYTAVEQALGDGTLPGQELDVDFANLALSVDALNDFVRNITRSDGRLANNTVTQDTLAPDILLGLDPPQPWEAGRQYAPPQTVFEGNRFALAAVPHTATDFEDDLTAGRWTILADFTVVQAASLAAQQAAELARDDAEAARDDVIERYLGSFPSEPTQTPLGGPLDAGMLYFDTQVATLFVFTGTAWVSASSAVSGVRDVFTYTATAGQTVFSGLDDQGRVPMIGNAGLVSVFLNGVRLVLDSDYTVNVGASSVTLAAGAAMNDVVQLDIFGNFQALPPEAVQVTNLTATGQVTIGGQLALRVGDVRSDAQNEAFFTPQTRSIGVSGLATGGGDLSGDRTIGVPVASQAEAEAGTRNDRAMTPLRVAQHFAANEQQIGVGQTWQTVSRSLGVTYQNTTGKTIAVVVMANATGPSFRLSILVADNAGIVSPGDRAWSTNTDGSQGNTAFAIVPPGHFYQYARVGSSTAPVFRELR